MAELTATSQGLQGCPVCTLINPLDSGSCRRCGAHGHPPPHSAHAWSESLQRTWAWLLTSVILYIPANFLPIMYTHSWGSVRESTILGGVVTLWHHGSYPIAVVIFVASVLVPVGKIIVLGWLCLSIQLGLTGSLKHKTVMYRLTEAVGRWSMVDVYVVGTLVALIQLGKIMTILPGPAALAFAGMVCTTMLAARSFDSRLLWIDQKP